MVTTVTDNSPQSINTSLFSLDKEVQEIKKTTDAFNDKLSGINTESGVISVNGKQGIVELTASDVDALPSSTIIPTTTSELENTSGFITINDVGSSFVPITRKVNNKQLNTDITLTASDVGALPDTTVIPTKTSQLTNDNGFITRSDSIMKPNYTTGKLPAGIYETGQTVSVSASITTTRGNPVFISYSGDFNSVDSGISVPRISFELFVDGQIVQKTVVDNSTSHESDNTPFAGNALAVLSAGSHTIRLDAVLDGDGDDYGQIRFQEQDNLVNLVAFEL